MNPPTANHSDYRIKASLEEGVMVLRLSGRINLDATAAYIFENIDDIARQPTIWDVRECDFGNVTYEDSKQYLSQILPVAEARRGKRSALVCNTNVQFGLCRMLETLAAIQHFPVPLRTVRDPVTARAWVLHELEFEEEEE